MTARSTELSSTASTCRCPPSLPPAQQPSPLPTEDISSDSDEATRQRAREGRRRIYTHAGSTIGSVQGIRLGDAILVFPSGNPRVYMVPPKEFLRLGDDMLTCLSLSRSLPLLISILSMIWCSPESATDPARPSGSRPLLFPLTHDRRLSRSSLLMLDAVAPSRFLAT